MKAKYEAEFEFYHPETDELFTVIVEITAEHDQGVWRDRDGGGCPPSSYYDWRFRCVYDNLGKKLYELPEWINMGEIDSEVESYIESEGI